MFTVEERGRVRDRLVEMGRADSRLVACALIGSTAGGGEDRWSDLDVTFGVADAVPVGKVLEDWTARMQGEFAAVRLFDLARQSSTYRVFLLPGNLQVDLSFTPRAEFGAVGPRFALLWGKAVERAQPRPPVPEELFGLAVHHLVRARVCIERGKPWQAEYWISAARDEALSLACLHRGNETAYGRGFDELPPEVSRPFAGGLVSSLDKRSLLRALGATVGGLLHNAEDVPHLASRLELQLRELAEPA
jgi:hypothetical protein